MNDKMPVPDKDEARKITAIDFALRLDNPAGDAKMLVANAAIIEEYLLRKRI